MTTFIRFVIFIYLFINFPENRIYKINKIKKSEFYRKKLREKFRIYKSFPKNRLILYVSELLPEQSR